MTNAELEGSLRDAIGSPMRTAVSPSGSGSTPAFEAKKEGSTSLKAHFGAPPVSDPPAQQPVDSPRDGGGRAERGRSHSFSGSDSEAETVRGIFGTGLDNDPYYVGSSTDRRNPFVRDSFFSENAESKLEPEGQRPQ